MKLNILYVLLLIVLSINVFAEEGPLYIQSTDCKKDGSATLIFGVQTGNKIYTRDISIKAEYIGEKIIKKPLFEITGNWNYDFIRETSGDRTTLSTNELLFNTTGEYLLTAEYTLKNDSYTYNTKIYCPGFEFSCKLLGVYVDNCRNINNKNFEASVRIYGLGKVTMENLSLNNNIDFLVDAEKQYEDIKGEFSSKGRLPKTAEIENPFYGQYYFNISDFNNKIKSFVVKFININYIAGGCVNYPNISLYSYKECKDVIVEEKKIEEIKNETPVTGQAIIEQEIIKNIEIDMNTKKIEKSKKPLIILFIIFSLCSLGILYITLKRNFNKGSSF